MKKLKLLRILLLLTTALFAQRDNGFYLNYELNGKAVENNKGKVLTYTRQANAETDKVKHTKYSIFVSSSVEADFKISFLFYTKPDTKLEVGKIKIGSILAYKKGLPSVHVKLDNKVEDKYTFYGTKDAQTGTVEITKVEGDWVEGTFELNVPESYDGKKPALKLTKGTFKFKMKAD